MMVRGQILLAAGFELHKSLQMLETQDLSGTSHVAIGSL